VSAIPQKDLVAFVAPAFASGAAFLKANAPLYVDLADLETVRERIADERDRQVSKTLDLNLGDEGDDAKLDFSDLQKTIQRQGRGPLSEQPFLEPRSTPDVDADRGRIVHDGLGPRQCAVQARAG